jgi:hypothetical protein
MHHYTPEIIFQNEEMQGLLNHFLLDLIKRCLLLFSPLVLNKWAHYSCWWSQHITSIVPHISILVNHT